MQVAVCWTNLHAGRVQKYLILSRDHVIMSLSYTTVPKSNWVFMGVIRQYRLNWELVKKGATCNSNITIHLYQYNYKIITGITKWDKTTYNKVQQFFGSKYGTRVDYKVWEVVNYKERQNWLQSATEITKCDKSDYKCYIDYKVAQDYKVSRYNLRLVICLLPHRTFQYYVM